MSEMLDKAVALLSEKLSGSDIGGTVKFDIEGEGAVMADDAGVRAGDDDADVTLKADAETFQEILEGSLNPTSAFMGGRLTVDGDMGLAMKLASELS